MYKTGAHQLDKRLPEQGQQGGVGLGRAVRKDLSPASALGLSIFEFPPTMVFPRVCISVHICY